MVIKTVIFDDADPEEKNQEVVNERCEESDLECPFSAKIFFDGNEVQARQKKDFLVDFVRQRFSVDQGKMAALLT